MERFNFVFLVAGFAFFGLAFVVMGWLPIAQYAGVEVVSMDRIAENIPFQFKQLAEQYPEQFAADFGVTDPENETQMREAFKDALMTGKQAYIAEACWHCHSQQIRRRDPNDGSFVGNDILRWAPDTLTESQADEYFNEMNLPHLFGTRRVGPDLFRESGRRSNDWHLAHLWDPKHTSPYSVMPRYTWFFDDDEGLVPNKKGLALVAYLQWLGSWHTEFAKTKFEDLPDIPFDESWYPPAEPPSDEDEGDEYDDYGDDEEDY